jgi:ribonuclease VapC
MILDTSAVIAILVQEPGYESLLTKMARSEYSAIGAPTLAETGIVLTAILGKGAMGLLARFLQEFAVEMIPFGADHWREAVLAYGIFGKGRHPASLNFGDCLTYAVAKLSGRPLLFLGHGFSQTDLPCS